MKKSTLSRILGLALALVLVLSTTVAFALPSGTSAIEGLPEMPTVPTMTTAAKGTEVTITLSEPMAWLNVIQNWNWNDIIKWSDDKLTGTYSTKDMSTQPGFGTWEWNGQGNGGWWEYWKTAAEATADSPKNSYDYYNKNDDGHGNPVGGASMGYQREVGVDTGFMVYKPTSIYLVPFEDDGEVFYGYDYDLSERYDLATADADNQEMALWSEVVEAQIELIDKYKALKDETAVAFLENNLLGYVEYYEDGIGRVNTHWWSQSFGTYDLGGPGFYKDPDDYGPGSEWSLGYAYNGATNDGTNVYYGRYGEVVQISKDLTGVNFLGTDKTPVKTTVTWIPLEHYGKKAYNYYINQITEEYEDGSKLTAHFSSSKGGKLLGTKAE
jgi:hypothetical protein